MPPYRSIDHVMLRLTAAEPLFDLFSRVFGLPVAWPLQRTAFATYGWVHVGNTDLELWAAASNADLPAHAQPPLVHGFALEPAGPLSAAMAQVAALGIQCKPSRPFQSTNAHGEVVTNFTNSVLLDLSAPECCVFFCEWNAQGSIYPWGEAATPTQRRAQHRQALQGQAGGPLGLLGLQTVRMGTPDLAAHQCRWQALTGTPPGHAVRLAPGIGLELFPAGQLRIESLTFGVHSLATARAFLAPRQLLQADSTTEDTLALACEGLQIRLVQGPGEQA
ncbi:hypothetical protein PMI14_00064 [Acidovorax sp. CF316]|uniref:hypothetical protein n=1 Tax=Acidovorax sp. CF316 TaxID=1144317 RepID=UPI00026BD694|nr:hypothetical protein [Acidovorax sp. CF316]EJE54991.1 hypothetical protein PMI14_00064 [Acidovorax sp. CF316]